MTLHIHPLEIDGLRIVRDNVADPFRVADGGLQPRVTAADYVVVDELEKADIAALPAHWSTYRGGLRARALERIEEVARAGRSTIVWGVGDHEARVPHPRAVVFGLAAQADRGVSAQQRHTYPVFIEDLIDTSVLPQRNPPARADRPLVGFCGQAAEGRAEAGRRLLTRGRQHLRALGPTSRYYPEPWTSHIGLRARALDALRSSGLVDTDFVIRDRYRAGLRDSAARRDPTEASTLEFQDNILRTDYTVCVRGGGNFSVRFYECLSLGRIPVLVDTHCLLPWRDEVDWPALAVIVPADDLSGLPEQLGRRHQAAGSPEAIRAWQGRCRQVWVDRLSLDGFFSRFSRHFTR